MTLNELKPGSSCRIKKIRVRGIVGQRLRDMGFHPGIDIDVVRNAPLVDPVELKLEDSFVSIRHLEAQNIEVEPL